MSAQENGDNEQKEINSGPFELQVCLKILETMIERFKIFEHKPEIKHLMFLEKLMMVPDLICMSMEKQLSQQQERQHQQQKYSAKLEVEIQKRILRVQNLFAIEMIELSKTVATQFNPNVKGPHKQLQLSNISQAPQEQEPLNISLNSEEREDMLPGLVLLENMLMRYKRFSNPVVRHLMFLEKLWMFPDALTLMMESHVSSPNKLELQRRIANIGVFFNEELTELTHIIESIDFSPDCPHGQRVMHEARKSYGFLVDSLIQ